MAWLLIGFVVFIIVNLLFTVLMIKYSIHSLNHDERFKK